jgi:hypothetical protein
MDFPPESRGTNDGALVERLVQVDDDVLDGALHGLPVKRSGRGLHPKSAYRPSSADA